MTIVTHSVSTPADKADITSALLASFKLLPEPERRLATLLAVAVSCTEEELGQAALAVWGEVPSTAAVSSFRAHPLIESVGPRLRVVAPLDIALARRFHDSEPQSFAATHSAFADLEQTRAEQEPAGDELQAWETRSRVAYYLLRSTPTESAAAFIDSFDASPTSSRRTCRLWLSNLAQRYTNVSGERTRVGDFFFAFQLYVAQDRERAANVFEELILSNDSDKVAAVSLHLLALCLDRKREEDRRLALLDQSIALSESLGLNENLLLSRNSAIYVRLDRVRRRDDAAARQEALTLARGNDRLASEVGDPVYEAATRRALAITEWLAVGEPDREGILPTVIGLLREAQVKAERSHDLGAWMLAAISAADCYYTVERLDEALDELDAAVLQVETAVALPDLPKRQFFDELERLLAAADDDPTLSDRITALSQRFRRASRRSI